MLLYEFQAKRIFGENGIPLPRGKLCRTSQEAVQAAKELGKPVVVKAQVLVGGRGLAGGIKFAERPEQIEKMAAQVLGASVKGERPRAVLVEEKLQASRELYCSITYDFSNRSPAVIASSRGGVDVETVAREHPQDITRKMIDPLRGFSPYVGREMAAKIGLQGSHALQYANITTALWCIFERYDAELVETNPLAIVDDQLVALDAKLSIDDRSIQRHPDLVKEIQSLPLDQSDDYALRRLHARELRIPTYIEMSGNVAIIADGAGTGMLTLDLVSDSGGKVGAYCEMGGETTAELMENAMKAVFSVKGTRVVLVNLIGGLNRMDEMAEGITRYRRKNRIQVPIIVRMSGTMEEEGRRILSDEGIQAHSSLYEAVEEAIHLSR